MDKDQFVQSYGRLVARAWTDDSFLSQLQSDPAQALQGEGIDVPAGVPVAVGVVEPTGNGSVDGQWEEFQNASPTAGITVWVPKKPADLSGDAGAEDVSTTCTPCTTCT
jgi:hypothetical protein